MIDVYTVSRAKLPKKRKPFGAVPAPILAAMNAYADEYKRVFKRMPLMTYSSGYVRIDGKDGVKVPRLKQLTSQLKSKDA